MTLDNAYTILYSLSLLVIAVFMALLIFRSIKGPKVTDRILSVNMINTMVIISFFILAALLKEAYLIDVALIYAFISFVSLLIFSSVYIRKRPGAGGTAGAGETKKQKGGPEDGMA